MCVSGKLRQLLAATRRLLWLRHKHSATGTQPQALSHKHETNRQSTTPTLRHATSQPQARTCTAPSPRTRWTRFLGARPFAEIADY